MSVVIIPDGGLVTQDPSDQVFYQFDWDTYNLQGGVEIDTSTFKVSGLNVAGAAIEQAVTSLIYDGAVLVTVVTTLPHGYSTQDDITIQGANEVGLNNTFTIAVVDATTFTFGFGSSSGAFTATGTIAAVKGIDEVSILTTPPYSSRYTQFRFTNAVQGAKYRVANQIVTNESPTQTKERSFDLLIQDR